MRAKTGIPYVYPYRGDQEIPKIFAGSSWFATSSVGDVKCSQKACSFFRATIQFSHFSVFFCVWITWYLSCPFLGRLGTTS